MWRNKKEEPPEYKEGESYTKTELGLMADALLKEDARGEICRECGKRGEETGDSLPLAQYTKEGDPLTDDKGRQLVVHFPEIRCPNGHFWHQGEGIARGIGGENPILFEEHIQSRRRREILPTEGVPDPAVMSGMYNRTHPLGRKVNSPEQRAKNGASYFR
jgi:hypothetical protein